MKSINATLYLCLMLGIGVLTGCDDDDHDHDHDHSEEETIAQVVLVFTTTGDGDVVTATWLDADGEGAGTPSIDPINLVEGKTYELSMTLVNTLADPDEDKTSEIQGEDDEHMFFFEFSEGYFSDPTGDGNVDNRGDDVNYNDQDDNGNPLGLSTTWTAGGQSDVSGEFTVILKHQPGLKTATSGSDVGGTDVTATFPLNIVRP